MSSPLADTTPRKSILKKGIGNERKNIGNVKVLVPENEETEEVKETRGRSRTLVIEGKDGLIIREGGSLQPVSPLHSSYEDDPEPDDEVDSITTDNNVNSNSEKPNSSSTPNPPTTNPPPSTAKNTTNAPPVTQTSKERNEIHQKDRTKTETKQKDTKKNSKDKNTIHMSLSKDKNELQPRAKNDKKKSHEDEKEKCLIS